MAIRRFCHSCSFGDRIELNSGSNLFLAFDLNEGGVVDRKIVQKIKNPGKSPRSTRSLIGWLVVAIVVLLFIYQVFDIALS